MSEVTSKVDAALPVHVVVLVGGLMEELPPPLDKLRAMGGVTLQVVSSAGELAAALPHAQVLFVWDYRYADLTALLPLSPRLRWVHVAAVGVEPVLSPNLLASGVVLTNSRGVFDGAIAEYVVAVLLRHAKGLGPTQTFQTQQVWQHRLTARLAGQRIAVVGTGSIGRRIGLLLRALQVDVTLVGRVAAEDADFGAVAASDDLEKVVDGVHALVLAAPLTPQNRGLVDSRVLSALGARGYLVNVGRGPLVVEDDLVAALRDGDIAGAALDVFDEEPLPDGHPLWTLPNVLVSPHMSADYDGFDVALVEAFADNLHRWMANEGLVNVVDQTRGYVPSSQVKL